MPPLSPTSPTRSGVCGRSNISPERRAPYGPSEWSSSVVIFGWPPSRTSRSRLGRWPMRTICTLWSHSPIRLTWSTPAPRCNGPRMPSSIACTAPRQWPWCTTLATGARNCWLALTHMKMEYCTVRAAEVPVAVSFTHRVWGARGVRNDMHVHIKAHGLSCPACADIFRRRHGLVQHLQHRCALANEWLASQPPLSSPPTLTVRAAFARAALPCADPPSHGISSSLPGPGQHPGAAPAAEGSQGRQGHGDAQGIRRPPQWQQARSTGRGSRPGVRGRAAPSPTPALQAGYRGAAGPLQGPRRRGFAFLRSANRGPAVPISSAGRPPAPHSNSRLQTRRIGSAPAAPGGSHLDPPTAATAPSGPRAFWASSWSSTRANGPHRLLATPTPATIAGPSRRICRWTSTLMKERKKRPQASAGPGDANKKVAVEVVAAERCLPRMASGDKWALSPGAWPDSAPHKGRIIRRGNSSSYSRSIRQSRPQSGRLARTGRKCGPCCWASHIRRAPSTVLPGRRCASTLHSSYGPRRNPNGGAVPGRHWATSWLTTWRSLMTVRSSPSAHCLQHIACPRNGSSCLATPARHAALTCATRSLRARKSLHAQGPTSAWTSSDWTQTCRFSRPHKAHAEQQAPSAFPQSHFVGPARALRQVLAFILLPMLATPAQAVSVYSPDRLSAEFLVQNSVVIFTNGSAPVPGSAQNNTSYAQTSSWGLALAIDYAHQHDHPQCQECYWPHVIMAPALAMLYFLAFRLVGSYGPPRRPRSCASGMTTPMRQGSSLGPSGPVATHFWFEWHRAWYGPSGPMSMFSSARLTHTQESFSMTARMKRPIMGPPVQWRCGPPHQRSNRPCALLSSKPYRSCCCQCHCYS